MPMEVPRPNENHKKLEALAGKWKGKETIHPTPWDPGGTADGESEAHMDLDGHVVVIDYKQTRNAKVSYRGLGVYGWDFKKQVFTMYWFDSMAGAPIMPIAEGKLEGNTLSFINKGDMGWGRYTYRFDAPGKFHFSIDMSQDGKQWMPFLEGEYVSG